MLSSMTGYGRSERRVGKAQLVVEVRAVNSKFLDLSLRLSKPLADYEETVRRLVQDAVVRGRIDLTVTVNGDGGTGRRVELDLELAEAYARALHQLKRRFKLDGEPDLELFAEFRDLIRVKDSAGPIPGLERALRLAVTGALAALTRMRRREGKALLRDLSNRLKTIREECDRIAARAPEVVRGAQQRLQIRIGQLSGGIQLDPARLAQEVAILADRSDVTEELTRLKSHFGQFSTMLKSRTPVGRGLDFLIQELNREVNTIGSKAQDTEIAQRVVVLKSEIEKIREQVQNIE